MRLVLALCVVLSHALGGGDTRVEPWVQATGLTLGTHAVFMFFAISGYLVSMSLARRSLKEYVIARLLRIYPALIFLTLLIAFVAGPFLTSLTLQEYFTDPDLRKFITKTILVFKSLTVVPGLFEGPIMTVWTLRYELILYAVLFLLAVCRLFRPRPTLVIFSLCAAAMFYSTHTDPEAKITMTSRLFSAFFFGSLVHHYGGRFLLHAGWLGVGLFIFLLANTFMFIPVLVLFEAYLILFLALKVRPVIVMKEDISYGIYISGWFPMKIFMMYYPDVANIWLVMFGLSAAVIYGILSWKLVEKPCLKLKDRML